MPRFRRPLALLTGLAALGALLVGGWSAAQFRSATMNRAWFVAPSQLAVTPEGTLYVGLAREVQVYAHDGAPRSAWYTKGSGPFRLRPVGGSEVELVFADDRVERFDAAGVLRASRREPGAFALLEAAPREGTDREGTRYALRARGLVRLDAGAPRVLVPAPPRPLAWFGSRPLLPITLVLLASLLGLVACVALGRREEGASARAGAQSGIAPT